ncbi:hypothetical protein BESB_052550 [Besnoitia besnoiti]|uniref:Uncharacterized protein n=1 Tax=Besnoitia besnoiti TaxID=94643 RepID=A0A2A9MEH6_BESBE|nr:hypothetical protein BESB_052550 [Besnoitia besnoiti]PFH35604.1 hypothetical protein BESB_052550 [Besnoitia besnoiti]
MTETNSQGGEADVSTKQLKVGIRLQGAGSTAAPEPLYEVDPAEPGLLWLAEPEPPANDRPYV